ncbi:MAG: hypothetical protein ACRBBT_06840 [Paracoccaceae bacterium]
MNWKQWKAKARRASGAGHGLRARLARILVRVRRTVPPGVRLLLGILLIIGGIFGFLPVLGFWMIPLGIAIAALDIKPLWAWIKRR